jgi:hypothetical protein
MDQENEVRKKIKIIRQEIRQGDRKEINQTTKDQQKNKKSKASPPGLN